MKDWQNQRKISPQRIYQIVKEKRKVANNLVDNEEAAYICASEDGVDLYKYLSKEDVQRIRALSSQHNKPTTNNPSIRVNKTSNKKKIKSPQFIPPYENEFIDEANLNNKAYPHIYVIENTLRKVILSAFGDNNTWWNENIVPKEVIDYAEKIRQAESKHPWMPKRGKHAIHYVGLEELKKIINKNWNPHFEWIGEAEKFRLWVDELIPIRNMIAHNCPITKPDLQLTETKARFLITLVNNQNKK